MPDQHTLKEKCGSLSSQLHEIVYRYKGAMTTEDAVSAAFASLRPLHDEVATLDARAAECIMAAAAEPLKTFRHEAVAAFQNFFVRSVNSAVHDLLADGSLTACAAFEKHAGCFDAMLQMKSFMLGANLSRFSDGHALCMALGAIGSWQKGLHVLVLTGGFQLHPRAPASLAASASGQSTKHRLSVAVRPQVTSP